MLATLVDPAKWLDADLPGWIFERKLDGLRCVAVRHGDRLELWSRNHNSFLGRFPEVATSLVSLAPTRFTLDGEVVAHDGRDFVGFGRLQQHGSTLRVVYGVFDVLHLEGRDTTGLTLVERKDLLAAMGVAGPNLAPVNPLDGAPAALLDTACRQGWEGLVGKRADSRYRPGRSADWVKLKCSASQELIIGGWTEPRGTRPHLGALLVGYYEGDALRYAGKVGSGFTSSALRDLAQQLQSLERADPPFSDPVKERGAHWAEPRLVANIAFTEWTRDGRLRHPRFEGLRPDKAASAVVREQPPA